MKSLPEQFEEVKDIVSDWAVDIIQEVVRALIPDGRPFGFEEQDMEEQLNEYIMFRGNEDAWIGFIQDKSMLIQQKLTDAGVSPDLIASVHPFDIAAKYAVSYSAYMETELSKRSG